MRVKYTAKWGLQIAEMIFQTRSRKHDPYSVNFWRTYFMKIKLPHAIALAIDEQERLLPAIQNGKETLRHTETLLKGLRLLDIPILITQQYTKGLGMSAPSLFEATGTDSWLEKRTFSCLGDEIIRKTLQDSHKKQVIVCGVEAHICVEQTVLDLLHLGYEVFLIADCVSSRKSSDLQTAIRRMAQAGAVVTSYEAILFELMETSMHPRFREISALIK